jgi:D-amino peptidase
MKIMIRSDIEGVTGVTTYAQAEDSDFARAMLANDLGACIDGILSTGEHEIVIYDEHTDGRNVDLSLLPESVSVICGKPLYQPHWGGLDTSFDAMMMIGFHARSGVRGALLPHSYSLSNLDIRINGQSVGEIGMEAAVAGDFSVPLWLVTGDSAGMAEAKALIPGVVTVEVKEAMGEFCAHCFSPRKTAKMIRDAAAALINTPPPVKPWKINGPVQLQVERAAADSTTMLKKRYPALFSVGNTLCLSGESVTEVWSRYCALEKEVSSI